jgi:hypothetical protein
MIVSEPVWDRCTQVTRPRQLQAQQPLTTTASEEAVVHHH